MNRPGEDLADGYTQASLWRKTACSMAWQNCDVKLLV